MAKRKMYICVQNDILNPITYGLRDFNNYVFTKTMNSINQFAREFQEEESSIILMDHHVHGENSVPFLKEFKQKFPKVKVLFIASSNADKTELVDVIQSKAVNAVLVRPFTTEQFCDNMYKVLNIQKPNDSPWYMQTHKKI